jgi:hypothetical protein
VDATRFDRVAEFLGATGSRRTALGLALGGLLGGPGLGDVQAGRRKKRCRKECCRNRDCGSGEICAGGRCVVGRGDCPAGADECRDETTCAGDLQCSCFQRLEGGTRCVQFTLENGACDQCETDADCRALGFPPGSSCIRDDGPDCSCKADNKGFCAEPCGFKATTKTTNAATNGPRR